MDANATAQSIIDSARGTADAIISSAQAHTPIPSSKATQSPTSSPASVGGALATVTPTAASTQVSQSDPTPEVTPLPTIAPSPEGTAPAPRDVISLPTSVSTEISLTTLYVDAAGQGYTGANVRAEPSLQAEILALLANGESVQAERERVRGEAGDEWYRVRFRSGAAYILASLLSPVPPGAGGHPDAAAQEESLTGFFHLYPPGPVDRARLAQVLPDERETRNIIFHYRPDPFSTSNIAILARDSEEALADVEDLLDADLRGRVDYHLAYTLFPPPNPGLRGFNRAGERLIFQLYDGSGTRLERQYLAAHELMHQVSADSIGEAASTLLSEGLAMYAGERYLIQDGHISLDGFARAALQQGKLIPLRQLSDGTVPFMGRLLQRYPYDEAGSFVGFLVRTYGLPRFKNLYTTGEYANVYGKSLESLEKEWQRYLLSPEATTPLARNSRTYLRDIEAVQAEYSRLFSLLEAGQPIPLPAYRSLDAARIAADRADAEGVRRGLQGFRQALSDPQTP